MTTYTSTRRAVREPFLTRERLEAWNEWSRKPLKGWAEVVVTAIVGFFFFLMLFVAYMLA